MRRSSASAWQRGCYLVDPGTIDILFLLHILIVYVSSIDVHERNSAESALKGTRYEHLLNLNSMRNEIFFDFKELSARLNGLMSESNLHALCDVGVFSVAPVLKNARGAIERYLAFNSMYINKLFVTIVK